MFQKRKIDFKAKNYLILLLIFCIGVNSCKTNKLQNAKYYDDGTLKELVIYNPQKQNSRISYEFYETGSIKEIHQYNIQNQYEGEQLWFFKNGRVDRKIYMNYNK